MTKTETKTTCRQIYKEKIIISCMNLCVFKILFSPAVWHIPVSTCFYLPNGIKCKKSFKNTVNTSLCNKSRIADQRTHFFVKANSLSKTQYAYSSSARKMWANCASDKNFLETHTTSTFDDTLSFYLTMRYFYGNFEQLAPHAEKEIYGMGLEHIANLP